MMTESQPEVGATDTTLDGPHSPRCRVARPPWLAGTPTLPFLSVFPGNVDKGAIEKKNLYRKYRQNRWLQSSLTTKKIQDLPATKNCGKDTDVMRQTGKKLGNEQTLQDNLLNRQQVATMTRQAKRAARAAQQDSVTRLSRVKHPNTPVRERISSKKSAAGYLNDTWHPEVKRIVRSAQQDSIRHVKQPVRRKICYHQRTQSHKRPIKSACSLRAATAIEQKSLAMVCEGYSAI